ncbi:hypothetical protein M2475_001095 [Breznakia sp. PF5-3]|uniref:DUF3284 domain-containing protein n=1 Tax=unclassified Breznakia TaxID=2623764 RepID=UPI00240493FF|nr:MULTISPECIES: DUF3284 domain-containing protein [unclassified Breznakia]MDF9824305.1 hypothetical protein [Breznakia sp. PM6-1]MDF9835529.1 hypothetical protein [Breznakia sp. PF5-3]MDF9838796.1 hypothetical protein [Breznakia sp. PFB2-8]MDF9860816.1 hypothetical protein [Breznakia sp. PH5-24]
MIVKKELHVSDKEFFDYILNNLHKELKRIVSRNIKRSDIKEGYTFVKRYKQGNATIEIDCKIEELDIPKAYKLVMSTPKTDQIIAHRVTKIDDDHIELEYEEDVISKSLYVKLNKFFKGSSARKKMEKTLDMLEFEIISKKK